MPEFEASLTYRVRAGLLNGLRQPTAVREVTPQLGFRECEHHSDVTGQDTGTQGLFSLPGAATRQPHLQCR